MEDRTITLEGAILMSQAEIDFITQFRTIPTTCISDALDGLTNLTSSIKPLNENDQVVGPARTVQVATGDNLAVLKAMYEASPGDVIVIDAKGDCTRAIAGDFVLGMAKTLGIAGFVVDGAIRDIRASKGLNFPIFCRGTTIAASQKTGIGNINVPISCGGVPIRPGDLIVGDADGVTVIPKGQEKNVLQKAKKKQADDGARERAISDNVMAIRAYLEKMIHPS